MRKILTVCRRELREMAATPATWWGSAALLLLAGFFFFNLLTLFNSELIRYQLMPIKTALMRPDVYDWVVEGYYRLLAVLLLFFVPMTAVRCFPETRRGSLDLIYSLPATSWQLVFGKFLAAMTAIVIALLILGAFPFVIFLYGAFDPLPLIAGWAGIILFGAALVGLTVAAATVCGGQVIGAALGTGIGLLLYVADAPARSLGPTAEAVLFYLSGNRQLEKWVEGSVHSASLMYFLSLTVLGLLLGWGGFEVRRGHRGYLR